MALSITVSMPYSHQMTTRDGAPQFYTPPSQERQATDISVLSAKVSRLQVNGKLTARAALRTRHMTVSGVKNINL